MKTALIHDWLLMEGGAEKSFLELSKLFPGTTYTLFCEREKWEKLLPEKIVTSLLDRLPGSSSYYRYLFPFFPYAMEHFDLSDADLILSSSHAVAKGVQKREDQLHICYCYTPIRYAWDLKESYMHTLDPVSRALARRLLERLRKWDLRVTPRVDAFIAISSYVASRIKRNYGRESKVIYPPVSTEKFHLSSVKENYYITHARLVPYKRIDLLVEAFTKLPDHRLLVIGEGPEKSKLEAKASQNIEFLGRVSDQELAHLLSKAKAYLFAAEEDFGIAIVEAQSAGLPVLALKKGGALEIIEEGVSGLFFEEDTPDSLINRIKAFEKKEDTFDPALIRKRAEVFGVDRFHREMFLWIEKIKGDFYEDRHFSGRKRIETLASFNTGNS